jgi:hypothetical protein
LVTHSGADSTIRLASNIDQANITVDLIVTFDSTQAAEVPTNVAHFINFYLNNDGLGRAAIPSQGFHGELNNIDLTANNDLDHLNIDDADRLQAIVMDKILEIIDEQSQHAQPRRRATTQ